MVRLKGLLNGEFKLKTGKWRSEYQQVIHKIIEDWRLNMVDFTE